MTPIKNRLKSESDWCSGYSSTRGNLTHGGPLLAVSPRTVSVEDPDNFIKATVELRTVGRETQGMGRCQLIQVVVGSKRRTEVPIERVPYVDWVVPATACNAEGKSEKWEKYTEIHCMLLKYIAKSKNFFFFPKQENSTSDLTISLAFIQTGSTKDPFTIENLTNEEPRQF